MVRPVVDAVAAFAQALQAAIGWCWQRYVAYRCAAVGSTATRGPPQCRDVGPALRLRRHPGARRDGRAHPRRAQAAATPRDPSAEEAGRFFAAVPSLKQRTALMHGLRRRPAGVRSRGAAGRRYRQRPHARSGSNRAGTAGSVVCCRPSCSSGCAPIGRKSGCARLFPGRGGSAAGRKLLQVACRNARKAANSAACGPCRPCAAALPALTSSKPAPISARSRCCSAISICRPRRAYRSRDNHDQQHDQPVRPAGPGESDAGLKLAEDACA